MCIRKFTGISPIFKRYTYAMNKNHAMDVRRVPYNTPLGIVNIRMKTCSFYIIDNCFYFYIYFNYSLALFLLRFVSNIA